MAKRLYICMKSYSEWRNEQGEWSLDELAPTMQSQTTTTAPNQVMSQSTTNAAAQQRINSMTNPELKMGRQTLINATNQLKNPRLKTGIQQYLQKIFVPIPGASQTTAGAGTQPTPGTQTFATPPTTGAPGNMGAMFGNMSKNPSLYGVNYA